MPLAVSVASSSAVRCRPAVGAAADPGSPGVDGLVALGTFERRGEVRRQRHLAEPLDDDQRIAVGDQLDVERVPGRCALADSEHWPAVGGEQVLARTQAAGRTYERFPDPPVVADGLEQQHLGLTAGRPSQQEPRRQHLGLVDHDEVAFLQEQRQIGNRGVLGRRAPPVDEQPGGVRGSIGTWAMRSAGRS